MVTLSIILHTRTRLRKVAPGDGSHRRQTVCCRRPSPSPPHGPQEGAASSARKASGDLGHHSRVPAREARGRPPAWPRLSPRPPAPHTHAGGRSAGWWCLSRVNGGGGPSLPCSLPVPHQTVPVMTRDPERKFAGCKAVGMGERCCFREAAPHFDASPLSWGGDRCAGSRAWCPEAQSTGLRSGGSWPGSLGGRGPWGPGWPVDSLAPGVFRRCLEGGSRLHSSAWKLTVAPNGPPKRVCKPPGAAALQQLGIL